VEEGSPRMKPCPGSTENESLRPEVLQHIS